jgi:hypothetical protein
MTLGVTLSFAPIVVKMVRVYRIFTQRVIRVQKLSNTLMAMPVLALMLCDVLLLLVWEHATGGQGGLMPLDEAVTSGATVTIYRQCRLSPEGGSGAAVVPLALLVVSKVALLLGAAVLAYRARKISDAYNETASLAAVLYNTLLVSVLLLPLALFVVRVGDTVHLLLVVWLAWVSYGTLVLALGSKLLAVLSHGGGGKNQVQRAEANTTQLSSGSGDASSSPHTTHSPATTAANTKGNAIGTPKPFKEATVHPSSKMSSLSPPGPGSAYTNSHLIRHGHSAAGTGVASPSHLSTAPHSFVRVHMKEHAQDSGSEYASPDATAVGKGHVRQPTAALPLHIAAPGTGIAVAPSDLVPAADAFNLDRDGAAYAAENALSDAAPQSLSPPPPLLLPPRLSELTLPGALPISPVSCAQGQSSEGAEAQPVTPLAPADG